MALLGLLFMMACEPTDPSRNLVFTLQEGIDTVVVDTTWTDASVVATLSGEPLEVVVHDTALDLSTPGEYTVLYQVTVGRTTHTLERTVFVVAPQLPFLTLNPGVDTVVIGEAFTDAGVTVTGPDQATYQVQVEGTVDVMVAGDYTLVYTLSGPQGIVDRVVRIVTVLETYID